jgi:tRNA(fMet)-specific endonuclease VapC
VAVSARVCLDTSAYSHFRRGRPEAIEAITSARQVLVPAIVLGELRTGFRLGKKRAANEAALRSFLREPIVEVIDVDDDTADIYADIMVALRTAGTPIPSNDVWIAALAAHEGAIVVTYDAHFARIARVGSRVLSAS